MERTPWWACREGCKDREGRRPGEAGYDPSSLLVPEQEFKKLTPTMKQYWKVKS